MSAIRRLSCHSHSWVASLYIFSLKAALLGEGQAVVREGFGDGECRRKQIHNRFGVYVYFRWVEDKKEQAAGGFEPPNNGFANRRLRPLGYAAGLKLAVSLH